MHRGTHRLSLYLITPLKEIVMCFGTAPCFRKMVCFTDGEQRQRAGERLARDPTGCWQQGAVFLP